MRKTYKTQHDEIGRLYISISRVNRVELRIAQGVDLHSHSIYKCRGLLVAGGGSVKEYGKEDKPTLEKRTAQNIPATLQGFTTTLQHMLPPYRLFNTILLYGRTRQKAC